MNIFPITSIKILKKKNCNNKNNVFTILLNNEKIYILKQSFYVTQEMIFYQTDIARDLIQKNIICNSTVILTNFPSDKLDEESLYIYQNSEKKLMANNKRIKNILLKNNTINKHSKKLSKKNVKNKKKEIINTKNEDKICFIILEKYGKTLLCFLKKISNLSNTDLITIMKNIANIYCILYTKNIYYCDYKPENFVIDKMSLNIKIIDFDLSIFNIEEKYKNKLEKIKIPYRGTPIYSSPEIKKGIMINPYMSDLYSIGIIFLIIYKKHCEKNINIDNFLNLLLNKNPDQRLNIDQIKKKIDLL